MSKQSPNVWYRLGHALESVRAPSPRSVTKHAARALRSRDRQRNGGRDSDGTPLWNQIESAVVAGSGSLAARLLGRRLGTGDSTLGFLVRASVAGAGAAVLARSLRPLLRGGEALSLFDTDTLVENVFVGAGEGLALGAVSSYVPGGRLTRGALYGVAGYVTAPWGGLTHVLRGVSAARAPVLSALVADSDVGERSFLEHVAFGVAFSLLYRSRPSSSGTEGDE